MRRYNNKMNLAGDLIGRARREKKFTKEELCRKLQLQGINFDRNEIYRIEKDRRSLRDFELLALCKTLDITLEELYQEMEKEA